MTRPTTRRTTAAGFTLIELMIVVAIIGILAAIAVPNFMRLQARAQQSEVRANLRAIFTAQQGYWQEHDQFSSDPSTIGFAPERSNRYAYYLAEGDDLVDRAQSPEAMPEDAPVGITVDTVRHPTALAAPPILGATELPAFFGASGAAVDGVGLNGNCPVCEFVASGVGNVDRDPACDVWIVSSADADFSNHPDCRRTGEDFGAAGEPLSLFDDVYCGPSDPGGDAGCLRDAEETE